MTGAIVTGWGSALPDTVVTNDDLAARLDTTDAWIAERTGIHARHVGGTTGQLAVDAGRAALRSAGVEAASVDLVVLATTTPDQQMPATASTVQAALGTTAGAFDVNAACAGFVYGLVSGFGLAAIGAKRVLVIGADVMTRIVDQDDRNTAVLFGDGAGALLLDAVDGPGSLLGWDLGSDGDARSILYADIGGLTVMEGREVFRRAVRIVVQSATAALAKAGCSVADVALFVPHQANTRIVEAACSRLGLPLGRTALVLDRTGNTSAGSVPLALAEAAGAGRLDGGDIVLLVGFGAGLTWASAVLRWGHG